uniref:Ig-like domain-containing protein n=1 Tax=Terrapene triunguis TaxID=2587831 RepID=A0A674JXU1_9SAUR
MADAPGSCTEPGRQGACLSPTVPSSHPLTPVSPVPPEVTVFPEDPVELGEPNVLICFVDKFFPPALSVTWLKNGQEVTEGVYETDFYPRQDNSFRKFSYLPFLPSQDPSHCAPQPAIDPPPPSAPWGDPPTRCSPPARHSPSAHSVPSVSMGDCLGVLGSGSDPCQLHVGAQGFW